MCTRLPPCLFNACILLRLIFAFYWTTSTHEGIIEKINIKVGHKLNQGDLILSLKSEKKTERKKVIVNIDKKIEDKKQEVIQKTETLNLKK